VVTQFPSFASADRAHYLMGEAHLNAGERRDASQAWEQFLLFFPKSPLRSAVQFRLGGLRFEEGDYLQAAVDFTNVLASESSEETARAARFNLAMCQEQLGDVAAAREHLLEYRRTQAAGDPRTAEVALRLGAIHETAGETQAALNEYAAALKASPESFVASEIHYRVGTCRETLGEVDAALKSYRKVLSVDAPGSPARAAAAGRLAAIHDERGETTKAIASYRTLLGESEDPELVAAVEARISELEASN
jgi:TolA-binding protein